MAAKRRSHDRFCSSAKRFLIRSLAIARATAHVTEVHARDLSIPDGSPRPHFRSHPMHAREHERRAEATRPRQWRGIRSVASGFRRAASLASSRMACRCPRRARRTRDDCQARNTRAAAPVHAGRVPSGSVQPTTMNSSPLRQLAFQPRAAAVARTIRHRRAKQCPLARMAAANLSIALRCAAGWLARTSATSLVCVWPPLYLQKIVGHNQSAGLAFTQRKAVKLGQSSPIKGDCFRVKNRGVHRQGRRGRSDAIRARRVIGPGARP
jgi:hypothetical protein